MHRESQYRFEKYSEECKQDSTELFQEASVKCPRYYKDSAAADLIESLCTKNYDKALILASSVQQAQWLYESEYLHKRSLITLSTQDRRERVRTWKMFEDSSQKKCLILNSTQGNVRKLTARLIIFSSPPKSCQIYRSMVELAFGLEYVVVCYSTDEISRLCTLQSQLKRKFFMIAPPDVESEEEEIKNAKQPISTDQKKYKVVVKNIGFEYDWKDLKNYLDLSNVHTYDIKLVQSKLGNPMSRLQTAFVVCQEKFSYDNALALNGCDFHGRPLKISEYNYVNK